jgi:hypothetical protein
LLPSDRWQGGEIAAAYKKRAGQVFRIVFGDMEPYARAAFHHTTTFIFVAFCVFCARRAIPIFFEETDEVAGYLHVIDTYGTLLLFAGFVVFLSLEIIFLVYDRMWGARGPANTGGEHGE